MIQKNTGIEKNKLKIVIISLLSIVLIVLLFFYFRSGNYSSSDTDGIRPDKHISNEKIISGIDSILFTFGINKEWIKNVQSKHTSNKNSADEISKEILIPFDLPAIELNHDLTNYFLDAGYSSKVSEDPRTKNITMQIYKFTDSVKDTAGLLSGTIKIVYNDSIIRNAAEVCIILDSIESYSLIDVDKILSSSQEYSLFLPIRNDKADYQSKITELKKDYLIKLFAGDEDDIEADFRNDMKESAWKSKIKSLCLNFPLMSGIILSSEKGLSDFENDLRSEFERNNIKLFDDTLLERVNVDTGKVNFLFNEIVSSTKKGKQNLFYTVNFDPNEFAEFEGKIYGLKKTGYKFFSFKDLMKRKNKKENVNEIKNDSTNTNSIKKPR